MNHRLVLKEQHVALGCKVLGTPGRTTPRRGRKSRPRAVGHIQSEAEVRCSGGAPEVPPRPEHAAVAVSMLGAIQDSFGIDRTGQPWRASTTE